MGSAGQWRFASGHKKIATTLDLYAHALLSMQQDAALRLGALLYGAVSKT